MKFDVSKEKVKKFWKENKDEIVVGIIIGCLGGICLIQRGKLKDFKEIKRIVGDKYDALMCLAKDVDNSNRLVSFSDSMKPVTLDQLINEGMPKLLSKTNLTKDSMIQDSVIFVKE